MRQSLRHWAAWGLLGTLLLVGCHSMSPEEIRQNSLVFGGINTEEAAGGAHTVVMKIVAGKDTGQFFHLPIKDGVFYHEGMPPGSYQFYSVNGHSGLKIGSTYLFGNAWEYLFDAQAGGIVVNRRGSIFYAGAFKIIDKSGLFHSDVRVEPDKSRTPKQLVTALIPNLEDPVVKDRTQRWLALFK